MVITNFDHFITNPLQFLAQLLNVKFSQRYYIQNTAVAPIITSMNEISTCYGKRRVYSSMELVLVGLGDKATLSSRTIGASNVIDMANDSRNENTTFPKYKDIWNKTNIHLKSKVCELVL